jgi:hypothetical protein
VLRLAVLQDRQRAGPEDDFEKGLADQNREVG